jgi:hypothetical protein
MIITHMFWQLHSVEARDMSLRYSFSVSIDDNAR